MSYCWQLYHKVSLWCAEVGIYKAKSHVFFLFLDGQNKEGHEHSVQVCSLLHFEQGIESDLPTAMPVL